jgi:GntR family transcriptional regulator
MFLKLDFNCDIPIYTQIRNEILKGIANKSLKAGDPLPSVRQLANDIGINMHTVNKAYNSLKVDGFLQIDRRKGALISQKRPSASPAYMEALAQELETMVIEATCRDLSEADFIDFVKNKYRNIKEAQDE